MFSFSWSIFFTSSTVSVAWTSRATVFPYIVVSNPFRNATIPHSSAALCIQ